MKKLATLVLLTASLSAHAEFVSGNELLSKLNSDALDSIFASGYVAGTFDALHGIVHCPPANVTIGQVKDMVKRHLEANPNVRQLSADSHVRFVLNQAWPCKDRQKGTGV